MSSEVKKDQPTNKRGSSGIVIGVLALSVIALGVLLYLRSEKQHELEMNKQELTIELTNLKEDLTAQMGQNDSLNMFIEAETTRLAMVIDSINAMNVDNLKKLTNYRYRLRRIKRDNAALVEKMDSTNEAYAALKAREKMIADSLTAVVDENQALAGENGELSNTVARGKQLVIASGTATPLKANGRPTKKGKKTNSVELCMTIAKNRIAEVGEQMLYIKLLAPNGKAVDAPEKNMAKVAGEMSGFNGKVKIKYQGEALEVCVKAKRATNTPVVLKPGIYTAAVMTDSYVVGTVAVELK